MKKVLFIILIIVLVILPGCGKANKDNTKETEEPGKNMTDSDETESEEETPSDPSETPKEAKYSIKDYFPVFSNKEYVYEGQGNEYASYSKYVDYFDDKTNKMQTRTYNTGTDLARVIENKDGKLSIISYREEAYYRDNILHAEVSKEGAEVLLMEPLIKGTQWTLNDQRKRSITNTDVKVNTPRGNYLTLEVTTEGPDDYITKDYYAPKIGLVKSIFSSEGGDFEVTSTLSEIKENVPLINKINFFYPNQDEKIYRELKSLSFRTNDITRIVLQKEMSKTPPKDTYSPLISEKTKINYMYLGIDQIAYIDFSRHFIDDMNAGASYESLILQSITNTIGNYYGVEKVYLTIDAKPYESGHLVFEKGELFTVNLDIVEN